MFEQGLELLHDLGLLRVKIRCLAGIGGEVVELRFAAVVFAKEFPVGFAHGEVGKALG